MNNPLATLTDQFLKERTYLKNVTPATLVWYRVAFKSYRGSFPDDTAPVPTKAALQDFVVKQRERGLRPVTVNTYIGAMNAFCVWLHAEGHVAEPIKLAVITCSASTRRPSFGATSRSSMEGVRWPMESVMMTPVRVTESLADSLTRGVFTLGGDSRAEPIRKIGDALATGTVINGRYRVIRALGRGGVRLGLRRCRRAPSEPRGGAQDRPRSRRRPSEPVAVQSRVQHDDEARPARTWRASTTSRSFAAVTTFSSPWSGSTVQPISRFARRHPRLAPRRQSHRARVPRPLVHPQPPHRALRA